MTYNSKVKVIIFAFRAIDRFKVCVALTFDHKVISAILNLYFNQHIMLNINSPHHSMHESEVLYYEQCDRFFRIFLLLTLDFKVISIF